MPQIPQPDITHLKQSTDLVKLIRSHNIKLRKRGNTYKGHCPFHDDKKTPSFSVNPEQNLWHCFGCDEGGDAIRFIEKIDKVTFPEAVARLRAEKTTKNKSKVVTQSPRPKPGHTPTPAQRSILLSSISEYYQKRLKQSPEALNYLQTS